MQIKLKLTTDDGSGDLWQVAADLVATREGLLAALDLLMTHKQAVQDTLGRLRAGIEKVAVEVGVPMPEGTM